MNFVRQLRDSAARPRGHEVIDELAAHRVPVEFERAFAGPRAWQLQRLQRGALQVVLRDMSTLQERIKLLQEEIAAQVNEDNNKSLFVLTVVTVLALPINIIAGLMGMNVGGVPLAQHPAGFWIVVAVVVSFTAIAGQLAFRKQRER